jgi:hypothetical protein
MTLLREITFGDFPQTPKSQKRTPRSGFRGGEYNVKHTAQSTKQ